MSSISSIGNVNVYAPEGILWGDKANAVNTSRNQTFETLFQSALDMINETNDLTNAAEEEEISFAMGASDSPIDLMEAQQKANLSLQYTVTVRNAVVDAYKEIMNLQF
jgi:flagellar hook-basal body complex protein FliE